VTAPRRSSLRAPIALVALLLASLAIPASASATEFPPGKTGYHSYTEVAADVAATAAAHPDIVQRFSIGKTYQGRDIWAAKISDNVGTDEAEPEAIFDGGMHADEHMGVEMTLRILHWLVDGYGTDSRITNIVNGREIWIVFAINPDGLEYDISGGRFHYWRKNRQPTPGTGYIGTDLNRNFSYKWGGGGRTSSNPAAITYRGPKAFSAPETRAFRDFLASRVVGGRQQIKVGISFHEDGRLVMWPYGYTYTNVPADMTATDRSALVTIGKHMAATNGYKPEQASDLYISSGTSRDYEYGMYRIFSYTFEMSLGAYKDDSLIASETGRNKSAVLYLLERAWCPYSIVSTATGKARCGAFDDDFEVARGWTIDPDGTDTAPSSGRFARGTPSPTSHNGPKQIRNTASGGRSLVTGLPAGAGTSSYDLDGRTTARSTQIALPAAAGQRLTFRYVFAHDSRSTAADKLQAIVEKGDGSQVVVFTLAGSAADVDGVWHTASIPMDAFAGETVRLRFTAVDGGASNVLEVELDDVRVTRPG